jgi:hypothetical protein
MGSEKLGQPVPRLEFRSRIEKRRPAADTAIGAVVLVVVVLARESSFGSLFSRNLYTAPA